MKYGNSSSWKRFISSPFTLVAVIVLFLFLTKAVWGIREKNTLSVSRLELAQAELTKLESHQRDLAEQIRYLSTEQGIESELRTKYRAIREGESVAVIVDDNQTASVIDASSTVMNKVDEKSWFKKVLGFFGF
jgi:cell division protein FtsB